MNQHVVMIQLIEGEGRRKCYVHPGRSGRAVWRSEVSLQQGLFYHDAVEAIRRLVVELVKLNIQHCPIVHCNNNTQCQVS